MKLIMDYRNDFASLEINDLSQSANFFSSSLLLQLAKSEALLLGNWDFAAMDTLTRADLPEIIDDLDANKATIIISQPPIEHWLAWVEDATITDEILVRMKLRNHLFNRTCKSLRKSQKLCITSQMKTIPEL